MHDIAGKLILLGLLAASDEAAVTREEAVKIAREQVIYFSTNIKKHVPIDPRLLRLAEVRRSTEGDGWVVTFKQDDCMTMIYVGDQREEVESTGVSKACFKEEK